MKYLKLFENMNIDPFGEEDWEEEEKQEHKYYVGTIEYDHIEIYPCNIEGTKILRYPDNYKILDFEHFSFTILMEIMEIYGIYINIPSLIKKGKLIYIYNNEIDERTIKKKLIDTMNRAKNFTTTYRWEIEKIMGIVNNHDIVYYGNNGTIINLI